MPACRALGLGWHVRPLLDVPHRDLLHFGERLKNFAWADPMNSDLRFDRAYLRQAVWPLIEKRWPGAEISLSRTARHMADAQKMLDFAAAAEVARLRDGEALSVPGLRALAPFKRMSVLRQWLGEAGADAPPTARLGEACGKCLTRTTTISLQSRGATTPCDAIGRDCFSPMSIRRVWSRDPGRPYPVLSSHWAATWGLCPGACKRAGSPPKRCLRS
jgi:hypothetical protein